MRRAVLTEKKREELMFPHLSDTPTRSEAQWRTRGRHRQFRKLADPKNALVAHAGDERRNKTSKAAWGKKKASVNRNQGRQLADISTNESQATIW
jgi:hypothetical protein